MTKIRIKPFETCSIRPPTENYSLTFRLTRNCYWNKCSFCPVYKLGTRFSKRRPADVFSDIETAKVLDRMLRENGIAGNDTGVTGIPGSSLDDLLSRIIQVEPDIKEEPAEISADLDPRLAWFLNWFKEKPSVEGNLDHLLTWHHFGAKTCFIGDGDNLIVEPGLLSDVIQKIKETFPSIERFTIYGRTKSAASLRTPDELAGLRKAGLHRVHFGLESGSDTVLKLMRKGVVKQEHIDGGRKTKESGLSCSVYVMPGLGGQSLSQDHAVETADALNQIQPDFIRLRSTEIFPQTPLAVMAEKGAFVQATETQMVEEIRYWVAHLDCETELMSDSASNLLPVNGHLPADRHRMLAEIDGFLELSPREKLVFSARSRLSAFLGQYGNISQDIYRIITPYIDNDALNLSGMRDDELASLIMLIRSKLMP